jgi:CRP-like cAMP-binding protein
MINSAVLEQYSFFGGLTREQINSILPLMEQGVYESDTDIIVEGTQNDKICFILEGRVAVLKGGITLSELAEGTTFGEMEVLDVMPSEATVKAVVPTRVMAISNHALHEIYKTDLKTYSLLVMNLARDLSRRLRRMDDRAARESPPAEWS